MRTYQKTSLTFFISHQNTFSKSLSNIPKGEDWEPNCYCFSIHPPYSRLNSTAFWPTKKKNSGRIFQSRSQVLLKTKSKNKTQKKNHSIYTHWWRLSATTWSNLDITMNILYMFLTITSEYHPSWLSTLVRWGAIRQAGR
jgi:hypothetical protein